MDRIIPSCSLVVVTLAVAWRAGATQADPRPWDEVAAPANAGPAGESPIEVRLEHVPAGARKRRGGSFPIDIRLSPTPPRTRAAPARQGDEPAAGPAAGDGARFGVLRLGPRESPREFHLRLTEPDDAPARLDLDRNADGDFANDPPVTWAREEYTLGGVRLACHAASVDLEIPYPDGPVTGRVRLVRWDAADPRRVARDQHDRAIPRDVIDAYAEFGRQGTITLDGRAYDALLFDETGAGDYRGPTGGNDSGVRLLLDLNATGAFERGEDFDPWRAFNIRGTTYVVRAMRASGESFALVRAGFDVPESVPPPDLRPGKACLPFSARSLERELVRFPLDAGDKPVLLYFWSRATRREEIDAIGAAVEGRRDRLAAVGVAMDEPADPSPGALEDLRRELRTRAGPMRFGHALDAEGAGAVARQYAVGANPRLYLIDTRDGRIVASWSRIAPDGVGKEIGAALERLPGRQ